MKKKKDLVCKNTSALSNMMSRLSTEQILHVMKEFIEPDDKSAIEKMKGKRSICNYFLNTKFGGGLSYQLIAELDMFYISKNPSTRMWHAFLMVHTTTPSNNGSHNAKSIEEKLSSELDSFFKQHTLVQYVHDAFWIRVCILETMHESKLPTASNNVFLVYYPESQYIFMSTIKVEYRDFVVQAIKRTFALKEIQDCNLSGKHIESLAELLLYQKSQGSYKTLRVSKDSNPLDTSAKKQKRSQEVTVAEDRNIRQKVERETTQIFGDHEQPSIEKVNFKVKGKYKGLDLTVPGEFVCRVTFEGPNILEGIKSLVQTGIASLPLPSYLADLHSQAKNEVEVVDLTNDENE